MGWGFGGVVWNHDLSVVIVVVFTEQKSRALVGISGPYFQPEGWNVIDEDETCGST